MGRERVGDQITVLDEDVCPDGGVRTGHTGHLSKRRPGIAECLVTRGGDVLHEQVRERVRQVARQGEQPVVCLRVEADGTRTEARDEALDELDACNVARRERGQEPGRTVEEIG